MNNLRCNAHISFVLNFLLANIKYNNSYWWKKLWNKYFNANPHVPISTKIHGYKVVINSGYTYPLYSRIFHTYNNPLVELAYLTRREAARKITVVDVGAAVGDTILLLERNLPDSLGPSFCIDGDKEFFIYLERNLSRFENIICINALLSNSDETLERSLIRTHSGTASSQGNDLTEATTLDSIIQQYSPTYIDVLKVDVDGFDGKVIEGASILLARYKPNVIFEWHPILYVKTQNDTASPFHALTKAGYQNFLFFTKYGAFSHFMHGVNSKALDKLEKLCVNNKHHTDWHYDVIALPESSPVDMVELAEMQFAKNKPSSF